MPIRPVATIFAVLLVSISLFVGVIAYSPAVGKSLLNAWFSGKSVEFSCLAYAYKWPTNLIVKEICVNASNIQITAQHIDYDWRNHQATLGEVDIKISASSEQSTSSEFSLPALPSFLPRIVLQQVVITHPRLPKPVQLSMTQTGESQYLLQDGWSLDLHYRPEKVAGMFEARVDDIKAYIPNEMFTYFEGMDLSSAIRARFELTNKELIAKFLLPEAWPFNMPLNNSLCGLEFNNKGEWRLKAYLSTQTITLDSTDVSMSILIKDCTYPESFDIFKASRAIALNLPSPVHYEAGNLEIPKLLIKSLDNDSLDLAVTDISSQQTTRGSGLLDLELRPYQAAQVNGLLEIDWSEAGIFLQSRDLTLSADKLTYQQANITELQGVSKLSYSTENGLQAEIQMQASGAVYADTHANSLSSTLTLSAESADQWQVDGQVSAASISAPNQLALTDIEQTFLLTSTTTEDLQLTGKTQLTDASIKHISLGKLDIEHKVLWQPNQQQFSGQHTASFLQEVAIALTSDNKQINATLPWQRITLFNPVLQQVVPELTVNEGKLSAQFAYEIDSASLSGEANIQALTSRYGEYQIIQLNTLLPFQFDSGGLQLASSKVSIQSLDVGIPITNLLTQVSSENNQVKLSDTQANLLGGLIRVPEFLIQPAMQALLVQLDNIELSEIMAIQQEAGVQSDGIQISGSIQGEIPITLENWQPSIAQAKLSSQSTGMLKISNNSAFDALKQQQPEIGSQLAMLEHLDIESLQGTLNLSADGEAQIGIQIKGMNPDFNQPVAFNYNHDQNLYLLLKSLRLAEQISNKIENSLSPSWQDVPQ